MAVCIVSFNDVEGIRHAGEGVLSLSGQLIRPQADFLEARRAVIQ
jgi:hypothetical protein